MDFMVDCMEQVWTEYGKCSSGRAVCICSVEVRYLGQVYSLEHCWEHPVRKSSQQRRLPQMALVSESSSRKRIRVLESRKGQIITLIFSYGGRVRIRMEPWGMSVSVVDVGQENQESLDASIAGLCNKARQGSLRQRPLHPSGARLDASAFDAGVMCTCAPVDKVYLSNAITNHPLCDPDLEDCPSGCHIQPAAQWEPLLNYVDISDQIRTASPIDHPQSDSAHPVEPNDIVPASALGSFRQPESLTAWTDGPNLGTSCFTAGRQEAIPQ